MNDKEKNIKRIKECNNLEGFAREELQRYADEKKLSAGDVLTTILGSMKQQCPYNFFGCSDFEGRHLAFKIEDIEEALGKSHLTCEEICNKGCCAYVNRMLAAVGAVTGEVRDEA